MIGRLKRIELWSLCTMALWWIVFDGASFEYNPHLTLTRDILIRDVHCDALFFLSFDPFLPNSLRSISSLLYNIDNIAGTILLPSFSNSPMTISVVHVSPPFVHICLICD
jgi:hypothetical protein